MTFIYWNWLPPSVSTGRESSIGITTRYGLEGQVIESRWGREIFCARPDRPWGHAASCKMGTKYLSRR